MKPTRCPAKEKIMTQEKQKKRRGEKGKSRTQDGCVTFKPKFCFLRMRKDAKCTTCNTT